MIERWWRIVTTGGETVWTDTDPSDKLDAAWSQAAVYGPYVHAYATQRAVSLNRPLRIYIVEDDSESFQNDALVSADIGIRLHGRQRVEGKQSIWRGVIVKHRDGNLLSAPVEIARNL